MIPLLFLFKFNRFSYGTQLVYKKLRFKGGSEMKDKILFVTKGGEHCDDGFSYVLELAKTLNAGIEVLIMQPAPLEDMLSAAAFAEEGDVKSARDMLTGKPHACSAVLEEKIRSFMQGSRKTEVDLICHMAEGDVTNTVKAFLKTRPYVDMVLLSPALSESKKSLDIKRMLKNISKPIVHISKPAASEI